MKKLPIGIQDFKYLRLNNYIYIDKTENIFNFIELGKFFFLARPRRFGKSLFISTLRYIFEGQKELFKGLWIENKLDWGQYNYLVIVVDFNDIAYKKLGLEQALMDYVDKMAISFQITLEANSAQGKFSELIQTLANQGREVVVLVDEYDKSLTDYLTNDEKLKENTFVLKGFYGVLKSLDAYLKFVCLTGVSKFGRVSIFSDLNNLYDLSNDDAYSTLLGYTQTELDFYFTNEIKLVAKKEQKSIKETKEKIRIWYNGYSWDGINKVYNPFSILNLLQNKTFQNFWFATGTPTFLVKWLMDTKIGAYELENWQSNYFSLDNIDLHKIDTVALLFQTGYLTVKSKRDTPSGIRYVLSYPNFEVKQAFLQFLWAEYATLQVSQVSNQLLMGLQDTLSNHDLETFFKNLQSVFSSIPYQLFQSEEAYYHSVVYVVLQLIGYPIHSEVATNIGRIDAVIEMDDSIYVFEFKMTSAAEALQQIREKRYFEKYQSQNKQIYLIGIAFDREKRNIGEWQIEKLA